MLAGRPHEIHAERERNGNSGRVVAVRRACFDRSPETGFDT